MTLFSKVLNLMREKGLDDVLLTGGGIIPEEDIEKYKKDVHEKLKPVAEDNVRLFYILEAIARKEGISVENNSLDIVLGYILSQAVYG